MREMPVRVTVRLIAGIAAMIPFALVPQLAQAQAQAPGALAQLTSPNSCLQAGGGTECPTTGATGLGGSEDVAVSPDGKNVYVVGTTDDAIAELVRNANGSLTQIGCVATLDDSTVTTCMGNATATGLNSPVAIAISPDGKNVYVAAVDSHPFGTVAEFERNADGSLTQLGNGNNCISENDEDSDCGTQTGYGLVGPVALAVSPDGTNVYVADSTDSDIAVLTRDTTTGALSQASGDCVAENTDNGAGCSTSGTGLTNVDAVVVSPDGRNVYSGGDTSPGAISEFARSSLDGSLSPITGNACIQEPDDSSECGTTADGLDFVTSLAVSPDGNNLYSGSDAATGAIAEFARSSNDGSLSQLGNGNNCIEEQDSGIGCGVDGNGLSGARTVVVSPDGANVYVATDNGSGCCDSAVAEFSRSATDGSLTELASPNSCIDESGNCPSAGVGLGGGWLAISPDGANVYAIGLVSDVAEFARGQQTLAVSTQGSGTVSDGTGGIACPSTCSDAYTTDSQATLTATAGSGSGSTFAGWIGGGCSGTGTCQVTMNADINVTATFISSPTPVLTGAPSTVTDGGAGFSGSVDPEGVPTTAYFEYGLDKRYSQLGASGASYTAQTQRQTVGSDFTSHAVGPVTVTGLVPNALYHVRLVATNSAGTSFGRDVTFTTAIAPAPGTPSLGETFNIEPVSGLVLIYINGQLVPLTQLTQIPAGVAIDTLHGTLKLTTATGAGGGGARDAAAKGKPKTQTGEFSGAVFRLSQQTRGAGKGLVTMMLALSAFKGAPSQSVCEAGGAAGDAHAAKTNTKVIQLLHASAHGQFRTSGRYSAATVLGTIWTIAARCDGTLTHAIKDEVAVTDFVRHKKIILHAGQTYLAPGPRKHT
jgi:6-phosphogluconolactonase (cycloisomerase 2 family)